MENISPEIKKTTELGDEQRYKNIKNSLTLGEAIDGKDLDFLTAYERTHNLDHNPEPMIEKNIDTNKKEKVQKVAGEGEYVKRQKVEKEVYAPKRLEDLRGLVKATKIEDKTIDSDRKEASSIEDLSTKLVSAATGQPVGDWVTQEERSIENTQNKILEREQRPLRQVWDGKKLGEKYSDNVHYKISSSPEKDTNKIEISHSTEPKSREKEIPVIPLRTQKEQKNIGAKRSEKYRSVGALQSKDIPQDTGGDKVFFGEEFDKKIDTLISKTKKEIYKNVEKVTRNQPTKNFEDNSEVYFDGSNKETFEQDQNEYRLAAFKDEYSRRERDYQSMQKKNSTFITPSMLARAKRKFENAKRNYNDAQKNKTMVFQEKPEIGSSQKEITPNNSINVAKISKKETSKTILPSTPKDKKKPKAFGWLQKNWRRASLFGAGVLAALSIGKEVSNNSASTVLESNQTFQKVAPSQELKKITTYRELKKEGDGYTQVIKRIIEKNPELMEYMCIDDLSPETMKSIGEQFGYIDPKTGNEIRITGDSVGGMLELNVGEDGVITIRSVPNTEQKKQGVPNVLRVDQSRFEIAEGEYASTKDGKFIRQGDIADPFNVLKGKKK